ncbi:MAG: hypothetical protein IJB96_00240 [Lachnospira sp.]|nr:hypothetical protein [Lachnospira sp.]
MFSVNIDKLTKMTDRESRSYEYIAELLLEICDEQCRSVAVVGEPKCAFKLATKIAKLKRKILFLDADTSNSVFLSKYRLGKNLKGFTDYLAKGQKFKDVVCLTNKDNIKVMFTGEATLNLDLIEYKGEIDKLLAESLEEFDMIVVASDEQGDAAAFCGGTVIIVRDEDDYDEEAATQMAEELENKGCNVLGVIIDEQ